MRKPALIETPDSATFEQRRLPRKNVLLPGMLISASGESASDCVIRDMHSSGAAISVSKPLQVGSRLFLLDTANAAAHDSRVAWSRADRSGLSFTRNYVMGLGLPPALRFLWRFLFLARLQQAERAIASGISEDVALGTAGLTREFIHQMGRYASSDKHLMQLVQRAVRLLDD
jgi:PilZ domain